MGAGRLYTAVAAGGFRRYATYRAATAAGVFTNTVFGLIFVYTYRALWDERPHLGGYDQAQVVTYVWLAQALLSTLAIGGGGVEEELMERIRTGDVVIDLYRPADLQLWWLAADLGRAFFQLVARGLFPFLFGALCFPVYLPADAGTWVAFLGAVLLAMLVGFGIRYLVALTAFWLLDGMGVAQMAWLLGYFCSGMLLPLNVFPGALGEVVRALPWSSLLQAPADVLLGRGEPLRTYLFQATWAVVLLGAGRLVQSAATRRVVVQGG
ncbi:ABC-2 family transporter protein [Streptomyces actinomycinicus]|uniref:ABC-2 family transporter protein n=1 Tax=Streptomyces actinomycinicus TaxID=1695166 RepID=A0A937EDL3_9ACTN|nr:ABC-2 family transporter protein [Streptomyces actinomycinicus]MBL1080415.1 ABC-2 family transporter protein [Streptomyces actinomycinicus]